MPDDAGALSLCFRVETRLCAIPLEHVVETMRALPIESMPGAPECVAGVAVVRGAPLVVIDVGVVLGGAPGARDRFITLSIGERRVALAVDDVLGIRALGHESAAKLPPLLQSSASEMIDTIGTRDAELLLTLQSARLVPDELWTELEPARMAA